MTELTSSIEALIDGSNGAIAPRAENGFLRSLSPNSHRLLEDHLILVQLATGAQMQRNGDPIDGVYFPTSCLLALISRTEAGQTVETSMAGNEGAVGLIDACASGISNVDCIVQVDGSAWRCPQKVCRELAMSDSQFNACAWRLAQLQLMESRQSAVCEALHPVEKWFARWMLESTDRSGGRNPLPMTQEFLTAMLGVRTPKPRSCES